MAFTLTLHREVLQPAIRCDRCGADVPSSGFQLWRPTGDRAAGDCHSAQLCGEDCLDTWLSRQADADEWLAVPLDAYLANLIVALDVDVAAVLEREQAVWATEHTRHEAPD